MYGVPREVHLCHSDIGSVPGADPIFRLCVEKGERQRERDFERGRLLLVVIAVFRKIHNQKSSVQNRARLSPTARFARETQSESLARDAVTRFALEGRG